MLRIKSSGWYTNSAFSTFVCKKPVKRNGHEYLSNSSGEESCHHEWDDKDVFIGHLHDDDHCRKWCLNNAGKKGNHAKQCANFEISKVEELSNAEAQTGANRQARGKNPPGHAGQVGEYRGDEFFQSKEHRPVFK